jgi:hypothetical protein
MSPNRVARGTAPARFLPTTRQRAELALASHRSIASVWRAYNNEPISELVYSALCAAAKSLGYPAPPMPTSIATHARFEATRG